MNKTFKYKVIAALTPVLILSSCSTEEEEKLTLGDYIVSRVTAECVKPETADKTRDEEESGYPGDVEPIIIDSDSFDTSSILYISQMGPSESTNPNFTYLGADAVPYCYRYQYYENDEADWDNEYNFKAVESTDPIDWGIVKALGSVGNSFSFYSFYFPGTNTVSFSVETDQRGSGEDVYDLGNFIKSDIMGAYHSTASLFSRLRFRLYHLMVYLKITLYVPDYESIDNDGTYNYSGFEKDALVGAYVLNASTGVNIEWRANRSSDIDAPLTQPNSTKGNITMYEHERNDEVLELTGLQQYYASATDDSDKVRAYNFSVLVPGQPFSGDFICFVLKDTENRYRYYNFNTGQVIGSTGELALNQGTLQQLYLYLPRKTNETILIGANILPWSQGVTDMTVSKENEDTIDEDVTD